MTGKSEDSSRPTEAEKADAVMRLLDEFDAAHEALTRAVKVLRERRPNSGSGYAGPLFPYIGDQLYGFIEKARTTLWDARKVAAVQFQDSTRAVQRAEREAAAS